ncbi:SPOR domain-containing protein [Benzoatithermus flavus]|uniref:SPOR domain-containing protein n=1 Tax=Benzoatithermus flavus TaxID=3108223 RepID=A0ABU8XVP3_9PROT
MLDAKGVMEPYQEPRQTRGWLTLVLGALVFTVFGGVVGYAWFNGMGGTSGEPPLIRAEAGPYRRAPAERGGLEVANVSSSIVSVLRPKAEPPRVERLLPPETPMALEATLPEDDAAPATDDAKTPSAAAAAAPAPAQPDAPASPPAAPPEAMVAAPAEPPVTTAEKPVPQPKPAPPAQIAAREPATAPLRPPASVAAPPRPAPQPEAAVPQRQARIEPAAPASIRPQPVVPPARAGGELYRLQLTAVRSEAGLTQAWAQLKQRYPRVLANLSPRVERVETSTGPLFRLQAGPFTSREAAANACSGIRESGGQCFIIGPMPQ